MMPIRIAYALPGTALSGGVKVVLEQVLSLNRWPGIEAAAVTDGVYPEWLGAARLPLICCDPLRFDFSGHDVVVSTFYTQGALWEKWAGKALVHFCQGFEGDYAEEVGKAQHLPIIDRFYRSATPIVTVNQYLRRRLAQFGGKVFCVGQGIDHRIFSPGSPDRSAEPRALIVGPFDLPFKGVATALHTAHHIKRLRPEVRIRRVSPCDTREAESTHFRADEYFVGLNPAQMAAVYRTSDLLLYLPSKEGFGLPLIEAMACGTPVVACDIPPFREICRNRYPLVTTTDPSKLAGLVLDLLDRKDELLAMRNAGIAIAGRYRYWRVISKLIPLFYYLRGRSRLRSRV